MAASAELPRLQPCSSVPVPPPRQGVAVPGWRPPLTRLRASNLRARIFGRARFRRFLAAIDTDQPLGLGRDVIDQRLGGVEEVLDGVVLLAGEVEQVGEFLTGRNGDAQLLDDAFELAVGFSARFLHCWPPLRCAWCLYRKGKAERFG